MTAAERGRLGGMATSRRHGREHLQRIGRLGGLAVSARYDMQALGRRGGMATLARYGVDHMRQLALALHRRYKTVPVGTSGYALVDRRTNTIRAINAQIGR